MKAEAFRSQTRKASRSLAQPCKQAAFTLRHSSIIAVCFAFAGCAEIGDFGRAQPSVLSEYTSSWFGDAGRGNKAAAAALFILTDDEKLLRQLADPLMAPPHPPDGSWGMRVRAGALQPSRSVSFDQSQYGTVLLETPYRSATARYSRLIDDIRNDIVRIDPFVMTARRVIDLDVKRDKSLAYLSNLAPQEQAAAKGRMRENAKIIEAVRRSLVERGGIYRNALERLVVAAPSPTAVDAERAVVDFNGRATAI